MKIYVPFILLHASICKTNLFNFDLTMRNVIIWNLTIIPASTMFNQTEDRLCTSLVNIETSLTCVCLCSTHIFDWFNANRSIRKLKNAA